MQTRQGLTITELMVVLTIITVLLSLLLPALQTVRERARETVCKNNIRQLDIAFSQLVQATKKPPRQPPPGQFGGWMVEILPLIEQSNLRNNIPIGSKITDWHEFNRPPPIYICPVRRAFDEPARGMWPAHYVTEGGASIFDAPLNVRIPWGNSPQLKTGEVRTLVGPHHGGFNFNAAHGVEFTEGNRKAPAHLIASDYSQLNFAAR